MNIICISLASSIVVILLDHVKTEKIAHICHFEKGPTNLSCSTGESIYVTSQKYGIRKYSTTPIAKICNGVDASEVSCIYEAPTTYRCSHAGSHCNGNNTCKLSFSAAEKDLKWGLDEIKQRASCNRNISINHMAMEITYTCFTDSLMNTMCEDSTKKFEEEVHLLANRNSEPCMCNISGHDLSIRALEMQQVPKVFEIISNNNKCKLPSKTRYYNNLLNCGEMISSMTIKAKLDNRNRMWIKIIGNGTITIGCRPTDLSSTGNSVPNITETSIGKTISSLSSVTSVTETKDINTKNSNVRLSVTPTTSNEERESSQSTLAASLITVVCVLLALSGVTVYIVKKYRSVKTASSKETNDGNMTDANLYACTDVVNKKDIRLVKGKRSGETDTVYHHLSFDSHREGDHNDTFHYDHCSNVMTSEEDEYHHLNI